MILRRVLLGLIVCSFFLPLTSVAFAQDMSETVLPITQLKPTLRLKKSFPSSANLAALKPKISLGVEADFGTGFCLDPDCRLIGTNYHVAMTARPRKIKGEKVIQRYLATGPDDEGATANYLPNGSVLPYATKRDLAIFELRRPLPHHHGLTFSLDELQVGQEVDIYGYPKGVINPIRKLTRFPATFKAPTTSGLLAFDYQLSADEPIRIGGASGGIVVDRKTEKIVGILSGSTEATAQAVAVQTLVDFVSKVQPWMAQSIFPSATRGTIPPASADLYPKFVQPPIADSLQHRSHESTEVKVLREKAQLLADSMRNFIAVQTLAWGGRDDVPVAVTAYEIQVLDGYQRFREYPEGKKELPPGGHLPFPPLIRSVVPGDDWSELPKMVGTALRLKIHQFPDTVVNERRIKVFQYRAESEDDICRFVSVSDFGFFAINKTVTVSCYGEVWTDEDTNILRMSEHLELPSKCGAYQAVVTYGWLRRADETPRLIPLTFISTQVEKNGKVFYWCRGHFTDYRVFSSRARILAKENSQSLRP